MFKYYFNGLKSQRNGLNKIKVTRINPIKLICIQSNKFYKFIYEKI